MHLSFVFGGLLIWNTETKPLADARIIALDLVTVSDITNIKPTRKEPEPVEPEAEPEEMEPLPEAPEIIPETPTQSPEGELLADETPEDVPNVEPKPTPAFDLDAFSSMVDKVRDENPEANTQIALQSEIADRNIEGVGSETGNTVDPIAYIQSKMLNCYKIDTGAQDYRNLRVEVRLSLSRDGEINNIKVLNELQILASSNDSWRAARDNVIFALNECAPYARLPISDYNTWKTAKLIFQPNDEG
jgi:hypothetical protein